MLCKRYSKTVKEEGIRSLLKCWRFDRLRACPNEILELLCEKNVLSIIGNYDAQILEGKETDVKGEKRMGFKFTSKELATPCKDYLSSLPRELQA